MKAVQGQLGHSSISITMDRYSHLDQSTADDASDEVFRMFGTGS
jgi:integrase